MIVLALQCRPRVVVDARNEAEYRRLCDWLGAHPELLTLLEAAYELERRTV
jgi:hypothetical protein